MKMGRAGLDGRGSHRETSVIGQNLHVAAEGLVLTGVPQVVAGLGAGCDPVGAHQSAVQARKRLASAPEPVQDVSDVVGSPLSDDLQGLVQVPVGSGLRDSASRARARTSMPSLSHRSTRMAWTQVAAARWRGRVSWVRRCAVSQPLTVRTVAMVTSRVAR